MNTCSTLPVLSLMKIGPIGLCTMCTSCFYFSFGEQEGSRERGRAEITVLPPPFLIYRIAFPLHNVMLNNLCGHQSIYRFSCYVPYLTIYFTVPEDQSTLSGNDVNRLTDGVKFKRKTGT